MVTNHMVINHIVTMSHPSLKVWSSLLVSYYELRRHWRSSQLHQLLNCSLACQKAFDSRKHPIRCNLRPSS